MKTYIYYLFYIALAICGFSCSKDQGNYDYSTINHLTVTDTSGISISGKSFDLTFGDTLRIKVKAQSSISDFDSTKIAYYWLWGKDTIGQGDQLNLVANRIKGGENQLFLYTKDLTTDVEYLNTFKVNVNASISRGIFLLSKDENGNTKIYLKSSLNPKATYLSYTTLGAENEYQLGKKPISINAVFSDRRFRYFIVATEEGENPILYVDLPTMLPVDKITSKGNALAGDDLKPQFFKNFSFNSIGDGYLVDHGQVRRIFNRYVGDNIYSGNNFKYDFGQGDFIFPDYPESQGLFIYGFDRISERLVILNGKVKFSFTDNNVNLASEPLPGMSYLAGGNDIFKDDNTLFSILMRKGDKVFNFMTSQSYNHELGKFEMGKIKLQGSTSIPNLDKAVNFRFDRSTGTYYYAIGRTIYSFSYFTFNIKPYFTLPEDGSGPIVSWNFDVPTTSLNSKNIGIATYNANSPTTKKGSVYLYNIKADNKGNALTLVSKDLNVVDVAVDISLGL